MEDADFPTWELPQLEDGPNAGAAGPTVLPPPSFEPPSFEAPAPPPPPPPPTGIGRARPQWPRGVAIVASALLLGGVAGGIAGRLSADDHTTTVASRPTFGGSGVGTVAQPTNIQQVLAKISPAVVSVRTQAFQRGRFFPTSGAGSGTILTGDGEVLTNAHVVEGATQIQVSLNGESQARTADLIGDNPAEDVALIKIRNASGLPTAALGRSADLRVGDSVIALGNALDLGATPTVTEGIVSALNRSIDVPGESLKGLIQTDAAINPGNSGGPLVDAKGEVVGMDTAIAGDAQNIGFALAIDNVKPVVDNLRAHRSTTSTSPPSNSAANPSGQAFLGVQVGDDPNGDGALVGDVVAGSPAAGAGVQADDVITSIDGKQVTSAQDLVDDVRAHHSGDTITVTWLRNGQQQSARVKLASP